MNQETKVNFKNFPFQYLIQDQPKNETEILYNSIKNQIQTFKQDLDGKMDNIIFNIMSNNEQTIQNINKTAQPFFPKLKQETQQITEKKDKKPLAQTLYKKKEGFKSERKTFQKIYERKKPKKHVMEDEVLDGKKANLNIFTDQFKKKQILTQDQEQFNPQIQLDQNQHYQKKISKRASISKIQKPKSFQNPDLQEKKEDIKDINQDSPKISSMKGYEQILDQFSLHEFIIRKGEVMSNTEEFRSYKRSYMPFWSKIEKIIQMLEEYAKNKSIRLCHVDGKKIIKLLNKPQLTYVDLISCLINMEEVSWFLKMNKLKFKGENGRNLAVTCISRHWRGYKAREKFKRIRTMIEKIIQRFVKVKLLQKYTKNRIKDKNNDIYERFLERQQNFQLLWAQLRFHKRIEIHINSNSYSEMMRLTTEKFLQKQNQQITRLFRLADPQLEIVYVCPFDLSEDILQYYYKVLQLGNIQNIKERLFIVTPNQSDEFPSHYSLIQQILYSEKSIKRIKKLIKNKCAYIINGYPNNDDIKLSDKLNVPLFSSEPQKAATLSSLSSAINLFQNLDIPVPLGIYEIYDQEELYLSFSKLIAANIEINNWIFKIDNEHNGRGIAIFRADKIKPLKEIRKNKSLSIEDKTKVIKQILIDYLPTKLKVAVPSLYLNYKEYLNTFYKRGGAIEAMPNTKNIKPFSVSFLIEPDGKLQILGTYDKISSRECINFGCIYPQSAIKNFNSQSICELLAEALYKQGIFGYNTMDLLAFDDPENSNNKLFWAIGLDCFLNSYSSSFFYFDFIVQGNFDPHTNNYTISNNLSSSELINERCFFYTPYLYHPGLCQVQYNTFFHMCRIEQIFFDIDKKSGATFLLLDSLQTGVISLMGIGKSQQQIYEIMNKALSFIVNMNGKIVTSFQQFSRTDDISFSDIISKIKQVLNQDQRKKRSLSLQNDINNFQD